MRKNIFSLKVCMKHAAFQDGSKYNELARILREVAAQVERGVHEGEHPYPLQDINGNRAGSFKFLNDRHEAYFSEFVVLDGLKQHRDGLNYIQWLQRRADEGQ